MRDLTMEDMFDDLAERMLSEDAAVEQGRMLRAVGLKTAGKFFAMVIKGELVVKLPAQRVAALVAGGAGRPFERGPGRPMKEWVSLRPADATACAAYVGEARRFVASQAQR